MENLTLVWEHNKIILTHPYKVTWLLVFFGHFYGKCSVIPSSWVLHCFHQSLPTWLPKTLYIVVLLDEPIIYNFSQRFRMIQLVLLYAIYDAGLQLQPGADVETLCLDVPQLIQDIKYIIIA